ncbi:MAG: hypothetical protein EOP83_16015 [Verrucomicrobiaceae bacterium]|nr:MAG: hypothetical protein EOP83_16015 [Verrucomicrobiaceae bacterium]
MGCVYLPEDRYYTNRFMLPAKDVWTDERMKELTDWLIAEFGEDHTERWYVMQWTIFVPDPTIAMMFRIRWC